MPTDHCATKRAVHRSEPAAGKKKRCLGSDRMPAQINFQSLNCVKPGSSSTLAAGAAQARQRRDQQGAPLFTRGNRGGFGTRGVVPLKGGHTRACRPAPVHEEATRWHVGSIGRSMATDVRARGCIGPDRETRGQLAERDAAAPCLCPHHLI